MKVDQVLSAAGPVDAVTNQALAWRGWFRRWGWSGDDYAARREPETRRHVRPLRELDAGTSDVVIVHYSGYAEDFDGLIETDAPILLLSHNITPAEWFWAYEPVEGVRCQLASQQLAESGGKARTLAGVSRFNADELSQATGRQTEVIPVLFDRERLGRGGRQHGDRRPGSAPQILFVGRLSPHKRQDLLIRAFAAFLRRRPGARLQLVGTPLSPSYLEHLRRLADSLAPGAVSFERGVGQSELIKRYRAADLFVCLSEHEGFCIPLLEAFHFGVPVVARDAGAVGEVVDGAGVLLEPRDDLATIAALLEVVLGDEELQAELRARGEQRLAHYDAGATAQRMQQLLKRTAQLSSQAA